MEDFLPLLIGFFWLAYTLYKKGQKNKVAKGSSGEENEVPVVSFLEEILQGKEKNQSVPFYADESDTGSLNDSPEETRPVEVFPENVSEPVVSSELEHYITEGQRVFAEEEMFEADVLDPGPIDVNEEFDLKKAVVYSEILHAPYI